MISMKNFIFPGSLNEMNTDPLLFSPRAYLEGEQRGYKKCVLLSFFGAEIKQIRTRDLQPAGTPLQSRNVSRSTLPALEGFG